MGAIVVVVLNEVRQGGYETAVVDYDQVVQALDANRPHDPLRDGVRVGGPSRGLDSDDAHGSGPFVEVTAIDSVAIVDQMGRLMSPRGRLHQLSPNPSGGRGWTLR